MKQIVPAILLISALFIWGSCKHEIPTPGGGGTDTTGNNGICFENDILPIFQSSCAKADCHDAITKADEYQLDSYVKIVSRGIIPGNAANSKIYEVLNETGDGRMPQQPNSPLTAAQISVIARWINEGAVNSTNCAPVCDSSSFTYSANVKPILQTHCLGCHSGTATSGGGIPLDTYTGLFSQVSGGTLLPSITHTGPSPMPKNGTKMSDCKIAIIRKWIDAGAPNN